MGSKSLSYAPLPLTVYSLVSRTSRPASLSVALSFEFVVPCSCDFLLPSFGVVIPVRGDVSIVSLFDVCGDVTPLISYCVLVVNCYDSFSRSFLHGCGVRESFFPRPPLPPFLLLLYCCPYCDCNFFRAFRECHYDTRGLCMSGLLCLPSSILPSHFCLRCRQECVYLPFGILL